MSVVSVDRRVWIGRHRHLRYSLDGRSPNVQDYYTLTRSHPSPSRSNHFRFPRPAAPWPRRAVAASVGWERAWFPVLAAMIIAYALLGSLRPVFGDDPFFLLNDARWLVEHHEIPSVDHFSYTAQGQPWIYPIGGGLLFYGLWLIGGYALLSWFAASATPATTALLLRNGSVISAVLTALAIPLIAVRTGVRADPVYHITLGRLSRPAVALS